MNELQIGLLILVVTTVVLFSGFPIAWGLALVSVVFLFAFKGPASLAVIATQFMDELNSFALLTIPLFILLGASIGVSAAGKDIYNSLYRWLARVPGGLIIANILACGMFSAVCGSSPATAAAIGKAGVPEMIRRGVPPSLATGAICAGGTLGILIPPSITFILYGLATETSIGRLFLAGVVPGACLVLLFSAWAWFASLVARRELIVVDEHFTLKEKMEGMVRVGPFLAIIAAI
ncbi:MAG TPA: TRAP transporter large permease subunit, partial [Usitatibacteraceae bacterium]|nr:TRAP transporter large permease subunit [Usitatibacteraceae bacterium]